VRVVFVLRRPAIIFAPFTFRPFWPKLQTGVEWTRQGVLTVGIGRAVAYLSSLRLEFVLRASLSALAPSGPTLLPRRL
jgi:hypothetical protein